MRGLNGEMFYLPSCLLKMRIQPGLESSLDLNFIFSMQETTQQKENLLTDQVSGRQDTCYGFSPGEMFPVSPQWDFDGTYNVAADFQYSVLEYFSIHHADRACVQQEGPT